MRGNLHRLIIIFFLVLVLSLPIVSCESGKELIVEFFYHPDCGSCKEPKENLEFLEAEYYPYVRVLWQNMEYKEAMELFFEEYQLYKRPVIVFNHDADTALYNLSEINMRDKIAYYLQNFNITDEDDNTFQPIITLPIVITSGLIDGINPCAFSLLIFFLSFLFSLRRSRKNVMSLGFFYILGVFLGYVGLGLGIIQTVTFFGVFHPFGILGILLLLIMGALQIRDAITLEEPVMKFPSRIVPLFKRLTTTATIPIALVLGLIVSLFEFPCSGGIYVGILLMIMKSNISGIFYLLIYNFMFVLPLIVILLVASNSDVLLKMDEWRVMRRRRMKLVSGIFLILLAFLTWFFLFLL
jgi:cytochrome c biogenesis protein CcdA